MKSSYSVLVLAALCLLSSAVEAKDSPSEIDHNLRSNRVSMVKLLANPTAFDGKKIFVDGIFHHIFEDDTLYLNAEMADSLVKENGIGLVFSEDVSMQTSAYKKPIKKVQLDYFNNKLAAVCGTFDAKTNSLRSITAVVEDAPMPRKHHR